MDIEVIHACVLALFALGFAHYNYLEQLCKMTLNLATCSQTDMQLKVTNGLNGNFFIDFGDKGV